LTIPKIKDLVNRPANAYKEIYEIIQNEHANSVGFNKDEMNHTQNTNQNETMKDELKKFLSNLNETNNQNSNELINSHNNFGNTKVYGNNVNNENGDNSGNNETISSFEYSNQYSSFN
jgi:hypothetical protein